MGGTQALISETVSEETGAAAACPRCGEAWGALPAISASLLGDVPVRRCERCGCRFSTTESPQRILHNCDTCGLPHLGAPGVTERPERCDDCGTTSRPVAPDDRQVGVAMETEVRFALADHVECVGAPAVSSYLCRILSRVAAHLPGAPRRGQVILIQSDSMETLALPSGTLLLSVGILQAVEDEAELAFLLGHELAHVASGDSASRLVQLGIQSLTQHPSAPESDAWANAAVDLVRMGYGKRSELGADARSLDALRKLDYDPNSALHFLTRMEGWIASGDERVQEYAVAHPLPAERARRLRSRILADVDGGDGGRVNREVFRRAAGPEVLARDLVVCDDLREAAADSESGSRLGRWLWIGAAVAAAAGLGWAAWTFLT